jgi:hypothetical protein
MSTGTVEVNVRGIRALLSKKDRRIKSLLLGNGGGTTRKESSMPSNHPHELSVEDFYVVFNRDVAAFKEKLPQLLETFPGEFVAIFDGEIVAHMPKWEDLVKLTQKKYPNKFVFVEQISPENEKVEVMETIEG